MHPVQLLHQRLQRRHIFFTTLDLLILNDTIKSFAGIQQLLPEGNILFRNEPEFMQMNHCADIRLLNTLRNLHFLLPCQKRDLPHLAQIHSNWII